MATHEETTESSQDNNQYPLLIIHEDDDDHNKGSEELDETLINNSRSRSEYPQRGRARGNRKPRGRTGRAQRGRARGFTQNAEEQAGVRESEGDVSSVSGRGRGRARDKRPYRGSAGRSNSDRRYEETLYVRESYVDRDSAHRGRGRGRGNENVSKREREGVNDSDEENRTNTFEARKRRVQKLSQSKLIELSKLKDEPDILLLEVDKLSTGFINVLKQPLEPDSVYYVVRILSIISRSTQNAHLRNILREVDSNMLNNLAILLYEISMKDHKFENLWNVPNNLEKFLLNIIVITKEVMANLSPSLGKCMNLISAIRNVKENLNLDCVDTELEGIETLFEKVRENKELKERKQRPAPSGTERKTEPPNSFREIPIFPELNDLQMDERPFLRANKVRGKYEDLDTYLDVQFRLLREDYIQPLRKGISEYRDCLKSGGNVRKIKELKLYHSVRLMYPVCSGNGINHVIQFDTSPFKNMRWASSRRLLHGSLLCLSNDDFDTILYATVTCRDELQLKNGKLEVHFENIDMFENQRNKSFVMAETSAYFEAYRFILEGLQAIEGSMSFERYLVNCETAVKPPRYLLSAGGPHYNFSSLIRAQCDSTLFPVLNTRQWPKAIDLGLDSSQYEALKTAITKELAIIQGPPGTGKTFVGLKIAHILLDNQTYWKKKEDATQLLLDNKKISKKVEGSPMLVVCYTNHALDQFLEGLIEMGKTKIVRIGGRCKNESVEPYVLRNVKHQRKDNRKGFLRLSENDVQCKRLLKECEEEIEKSNNKIKKSETKLLSYRNLKPYMTDAQQDSFESSHTEEELQSCFLKWLGLNKHEQKDIHVDLSYEEQIKLSWQEYIVKEICPIEDGDRQDIGDILTLEPVQRAELYKAWVAELVTNMHNLMQQAQSENGQIFSRDELHTVLLKAENSILEADLLIKYASRQDTKRQLMQLLDRNARVTNTPIWHWLCLSLTTSQIKTVLEENMDSYGDRNVASKNEADVEDMEEDRELDEEDDYLFELRKKAKRKETSVEQNDDDWLRNWNEKTFSKKVRQMLMKAKTLSRKDAEKWTHVWDLSNQTREDLYKYWTENYRRNLKENVKEYEEKFNEATDKLQEVRNMETVEILKDSEIVGMTTTGAAKYRKILQTVRPQIIIVEEAAEVLESHIVTTLNENCKHLILIGDHKQLRPSTTVYALAKKYHMDISLFERMVCNNVPCVTLEEQHRMRPDISMLLTHESLYPSLRDHPSVQNYEHVKGIDENFQFITHEEEEVTMAESTSYTNPHEAKYLAKLCRYLLSQGYQRDQISVITPYMGQVLLLRKEMPKSDFEGVRITAVDNFQGEENEIILLSLVRSRAIENMPQKRNPIGFVGIENRICVSLSRAKMGFYVIGNFRLLEQYSEMWERMIGMMKQKRLVREGLRLRCRVHPDKITFAQTAADFKKVPEGGCDLACNSELLCGHRCPLNCHPIDRDHQNFLCLKPCEQIICSNNHKCTKHCYEPCGQCNTIVQTVIPMCDHRAPMPCHIDPFKWKCNKKCEFKLPCGHTCKRKCSVCTEEKDHEKECKEEVKRTLECGHEKSMKCHDDPTAVDCKVACETLLECKHKCSGTCGSCFGGKIHQRCNDSCRKSLPCGHKCSSPCSEFCPPCTRPCEFKCSHGVKCKRKCFEKCKPCYGPCKFSCDKHKTKCTLACNESCDIQPCSQSCNEILKCKKEHGNCRGVCGEKCFCIICQKDKLRLEPREKIEDDSVFIQLPNCYCILEMGKFRRSIEKESKEGHEVLYKRCPHCGTAITKHMRLFTNILKRTRENIVREYEIQAGPDDVRKTKIIKLKRQFKQLEKKGLSSEDFDLVINKLHSNDFGALRYVEDMKDRLIILMDICDFMERSQSSVKTAAEHAEGIVKASKLRDELLRGRRFVTKQFWKEVDRELKRMLMWAKFYSLNECLESVGRATPDIADIITTAFKIITRKLFNQDDEKILSAVYKNMVSMIKERRDSGFDNIKAVLDEYLKDFLELEQAEIEPGANAVEQHDGTPV